MLASKIKNNAAEIKSQAVSKFISPIFLQNQIGENELGRKLKCILLLPGRD